MRGRLTPGLALLRATGFSALLLLLWNPITTLRRAGGRVDQPLVLLDASLSMAGRGGRWREALDSARALARGGVIWRFGTQVAAFDSAPPADGASRLAPALTAAAARGGPIAVVTDGELEDVAGLAPDLLRLPHVVVLPRAPFRDAFVAAVEGPPAVAVTDTMRLRVSYGVAGNGKRETRNVRPRLRSRTKDGAWLRAECSSPIAASCQRISRFPFPVSRLPGGRRLKCGWKAFGIPSPATTPVSSRSR